MTLRSHINSVPWMNAATPTPYHECTQFVDSDKSLSFSLTRGFFGPIAYIHGTELMRFSKVTLRSTKISKQWLWPVKVTLKVIKRRPKVLCWSCDEGPLKWDTKNFRASSLPARIEWAYSQPPHQMVGQCLSYNLSREFGLLIINRVYVEYTVGWVVYRVKNIP